MIKNFSKKIANQKSTEQARVTVCVFAIPLVGYSVVKKTGAVGR